jgi:2-C-methyl-D-erythritol 4-phosphate cytidylyltransferase
MVLAVQAVVPLVHDDREAPAGCAGLRELGGSPMISHAVQALIHSGCVDRVLVPVPPALLPRVGELLTPMCGDQVRVLPEQENGLGARLLAALSLLVGQAEPVVVLHDALHPLAPATLVRAVVERLGGSSEEVAGVVPVAPVTDTLKWVDEDDVITGTADREAFRVAGFPQAYRGGALRAALAAVPADTLRAGGADGVPALVRRAGGALLTALAPGESFRVATAQDVLLAEALLGVAAAPHDGRTASGTGAWPATARRRRGRAGR